MKVQILGGSGGLTRDAALTSILIDDKLLIDAGAVASQLSVAEQASIMDILISHCHLDHIKDLAFLCDNCFGLKSRPFSVYAHQSVVKIIKDHLLNDIVWPDFTKLPTAEKPTMTFTALESGKRLQIGDYFVTPVPVNHPYDAQGFIIESPGASVLFTLDTGPTQKIWERAREVKNLKAIFTEVSFPNRLQNVSDLSQHHTPATMLKELSKMPSGVPVFLSHLKPAFRDEIKRELSGEQRFTVIESDGETFHF